MNKINTDFIENNFLHKVDENFQETGKFQHYKVNIIKEIDTDIYCFKIGDYTLNKIDLDNFLNKLFSYYKDDNEKIKHLQDTFQSCLTNQSSSELIELEDEINQFITSYEIQLIISKTSENIEKLELTSIELADNQKKIINRIKQNLRYLEAQINTGSHLSPVIEAQNLWVDSVKMLLLLPLSKDEKDALVREILPFMISQPAHDWSGDAVLVEDFHGLNTLNYIALAGKTAQLEELNQQLDGQLAKYINVGVKEQMGDSSLHIAMQCKNYEIAEDLIARGANINFRLNTQGEAPLLTAIKNNDLKMVDIFLKKENIDIKTTDIYGHTAVHVAVATSENGEMLRYLLTKNEFKALIDSQDIFGKTPLDLALENKNDEAIKILLNDDHIDATQLPGYGVKMPDISQANIINQWAKYVEIKGNDPIHFVNSEGECFGFSFLVQYYISRGKEEEVYRILNLLAGWDGSKEALADSESVKGLSGDYKNLDDLMAQWINDVLWCQQTDEDLKKQTSIKQKELVKIYDIIKKDSNDRMELLMSWGTARSSIRMNREQLSEIIQLLSTVPNSSLSIVGGMHATSVHFQPGGSYQYFDSNLPSKVKLLNSAEELVKIIMDTKYLQLGYTEDAMKIGLLWYCFPNKIDAASENSRINKLPENRPSPNGFTSLHQAIILRDNQKIEALLQEDSVDINKKDQHGTTALDWAISLKQNDLISKLLKNPKIKINYREYLINELYTNNDNAIKILINHYKTENNEADLEKELTYVLNFFLEQESLRPINPEILKLLLLEKANLYKGGITEWMTPLSKVPLHTDEAVWEIVIGSLIDINHLDQGGENLLHHAIIRKNLPLIKMLLKRGADPTILTSKGKTPFELAENTEDPYIMDLLLQTQK